MPVFEEKSKERKNVNDGHMFAAEVFVHEMREQEMQQLATATFNMNLVEINLTDFELRS